MSDSPRPASEAGDPVAVSEAPVRLKAAPKPAPKPVAKPAPTEFPVSLDDACVEISRGFRKPTLLSAFAQDEEANGRMSDTVTAYRARLEVFRKRPA